MSITANIIRGIYKRLSTKKTKPAFTELGWKKIKLLKHQDNQSLKILNINGQSILYKRPYELMHTYEELFEHEIYHFTTHTSKPLIIDCGANIGMSVLYFKALYPTASIIAFEPDDDNFALLQKNIDANGLQDVQLIKAAVWKENTLLQFASSGSQGSKITDNVFNVKTTQVQAHRLADFLKEKKVDFLKIDIEGAEDVVIHDCAPYLNNVDNLFLEYHGKSDETYKLTSILTLMHESGFKTYVKMAADDLQVPFKNKHTGNSFDVQLNLFNYR